MLSLGILQTRVAKMILSKEFLDNLKFNVRQAWTKIYGKTVEKYLQQSLVQNLGGPLNDLIR